MEHMSSSREAVERFAGLSLDESRSILEEIAPKILNGEYGQALDLANAVRAEYDITTGAGSKSSQEGTKTEPSEQNSTTRKFTFTEVQRSSQVLDPGTIGFTGDTPQSPQMTSSKAHLALQEWLSAPESRVLWIYGPSHTNKPSDLSSTSAFVVSTIYHAKLPLIAYQCQNSGSSMDTLISMVYSVIIQLVWLLPENFSTDKNFGFELFSSLDRSRETLSRALCLMEDLFTLAPRLLIVIIDGIQLCEDGLDNERGTGMYLDFFRKILKNSGNDRVLKTLFTTDGVCDILWRKLDPQEQVDAMNETGGTAAHRRKGRHAMG